ncbi:MAG: T9SS type A sorting domain-containing protein [Ignavibacteriales bacterium]|nr:MAG: T9SS type A sorting domain-containing protein [Ignavibacteriales bacterium]
MKLSLTILFAMIVSANLLFAQVPDPEYQWLHPKPIGTSMGVLKVWDQNNFYAFGSGGTFVKTTNGGQTFQLDPFAGAPNPSPYSTTNDIYGGHFVDMDNFYLCGVWGIRRTADGGQTFSDVGTGYFTSSTLRAVQFVDASNGFVVGTSSTKLAKTTDGGNTWTVDPLLPATTYYALHAFSTTNIVVGSNTSSSANIRVTTDGGTSWNAAAAGTSTIFSLAFLDNQIGFAGSSSGRGYKTTDGGLSWTQMTSMNAPTTSTFYDIFIKGTDVYFVEDDSLLFVTSDSGATFSTVRFLPLGKTNQIMRAGDYNGSTIAVVGDNGYSFISTDNGTTWNTQSEVTVSGFVQGLYSHPSGKIIGIGSSSPNQVVVSDNYGATWTPVALSVSAADLRSIKMFDVNNGYAVGSGGRIWKTTNGGYNWDLYATTTVQAFNDVDFYNQQYGMVAGNGGQCWKTTDGGTSWVSIGAFGTLGQQTIAMIDSVTAMIGGSTTINKTTDGGASWTPIVPGVPIGPLSRIRMMNATDGFLIGASGTSQTGYVFKTTDAGATWINKNFPFTGTMLYNIVFRSDSDYVVTGYSGGVFHTRNDGQSWTQLNIGLLNVVQSQVIGISLASQDTIIVGGAGASIVKIHLEPILPVELSSFTSTVSGNDVTLSWSTASELNNSGFEVERKQESSYSWESLGFIQGRGTTTEQSTYSFTDKNLASGIYNYRIKQIDYDGTVSYFSLSETIEIGMPAVFELAQNYPNPFNPSTFISYSIPVKSNVTLKIFDVLGNEIKTLVNESKDAGNYTINFNASDLSSGVYFYTINAANYTQTKKMTLIK